MSKIKIISGSIREGRFGEHVSSWVYNLATKNKLFDVELLDIKDYELPIFNSQIPPAYVTGTYGDKKIDRWAEKINEADGFIIITPEYNHSFSSALKNMLDYLYKEWNRKAVGFVAYGSQGGARAVEQLRQVIVELQMASTRNGVFINSPWLLVDDNNNLKNDVLSEYEGAFEKMISELEWWTRTLKEGRNR